jgi:hypothetical protein
MPSDHFYAGITPIIHPKSIITKIEDIRFPPSRRIDLTNPPTNAQKVKNILNSDLPAGTQNLFSKLVGPLVCETTGALEPWDTPDDKELIEIWNMVFGAEHPIEKGDVKCKLFVVVKTLVCFHSARFPLLTKVFR